MAFPPRVLLNREKEIPPLLPVLIRPPNLSDQDSTLIISFSYILKALSSDPVTLGLGASTCESGEGKEMDTIQSVVDSM